MFHGETGRLLCVYYHCAHVQAHVQRESIWVLIVTEIEREGGG